VRSRRNTINRNLSIEVEQIQVWAIIKGHLWLDENEGESDRLTAGWEGCIDVLTY